MKFLNLINRKLEELHEQVPGEIPGMGPTDPTAVPPPPPQTAVTVPPPDAGPKPLSPEGEVFLVRLLKKALFLNPGDIDEKMLKDLPEINETNASEVLNSIVEIMKKYSNSIDVDTENK